MLIETTGFRYTGPEKAKLVELSDWIQSQVSALSTNDFRVTLDRYCGGDWYELDRLVRRLRGDSELILTAEEAQSIHELAGYLMIRARLSLDSDPGKWLKPLVQDLNQYRLRSDGSLSPGHKKTGS